MHEFFSSAFISAPDFVSTSYSKTRTKRLYFIDDLSAAEATGNIPGNDVLLVSWANYEVYLLDVSTV